MITNPEFLAMNILNSEAARKNGSPLNQVLLNQQYIMLALLELGGHDTKSIREKVNSVHYDAERGEYVTG